MPRSLVLALLAAAIAPAPAMASTVTFTPGEVDTISGAPDTPDGVGGCSKYGQCRPSSLAIAGEPGEANVLDVRVDGTGVIVRDAGAQLEGTGCTAEPGGAFRCPPAELIEVRAGDGDDRVTVDSGTALVSVDGEDGNDVLTGNSLSGGPGDDQLTSAGGNAYLSGDAGRDVVRGGVGSDQITDELTSPEPDVLDGGPGSDTLTFSTLQTERKRAVSIDLRPAQQVGGSAGEGNQVSGFEHAAGGAGDDTIIGPASLSGGARMAVLAGGSGDDVLRAGGPVRSQLEGGTGNDRLVGGAAGDTLAGRSTGITFEPSVRDRDTLSGGGGDDELTGGEGRDALDGGAGRDRLDGGVGRDRLRGGPGRDRLRSRDRARDRVDGGLGRDSAVVDRRDRVRRCERVKGARTLPRG